MESKIVIILMISLTPVVLGHMCLISPPQRGSMMGLNKPGAHDCMLLKAPCGNRSMVMAETVFMPAEQNFTFTFQKNLDHWMKTTPGYFSLSIAKSDSEPFKEIARVQDMGEPSLHLYSIVLKLPKITKDVEPFTLQARYVTNNPNAPAVFYQCADIGLFN